MTRKLNLLNLDGDQFVIGNTVITGNGVTNNGKELGGTQVYASKDDLPTLFATGARAWVEDTNTLYLGVGNGWFKIEALDTVPTFTQTPPETYWFLPDQNVSFDLRVEDPDTPNNDFRWTYSLGEGDTLLKYGNLFWKLDLEHVDNVGTHNWRGYVSYRSNETDAWNSSFTVLNGLIQGTAGSIHIGETWTIVNPEYPMHPAVIKDTTNVTQTVTETFDENGYQILTWVPEETGTYYVKCTNHPTMQLDIVVADNPRSIVINNNSVGANGEFAFYANAQSDGVADKEDLDVTFKLDDGLSVISTTTTFKAKYPDFDIDISTPTYGGMRQPGATIYVKSGVFSFDGLTFYQPIESNQSRINVFELTTPYDLLTASQASYSPVDISGWQGIQTNNGITAFDISLDGKYLFYSAKGNRNYIYSRYMSTRGNISSSLQLDSYYITNGGGIEPQSLSLSPDGKYIYLGFYRTNYITQLELSVPWNMAQSITRRNLLDLDTYWGGLNASDVRTFGLVISPSGRNLIFSDYIVDRIYSIDFTSPHNISTATRGSDYIRALDLGNTWDMNHMASLDTNQDGSKLFVYTIFGNVVELDL